MGLVLGTPKRDPREAQERPKRAQEGAQRGPGEPKRSPRGAQEGPRGGQGIPREPQETSKRVQQSLRGAEDRPRESKQAPRESQERPTSIQESPREQIFVFGCSFESRCWVPFSRSNGPRFGALLGLFWDFFGVQKSSLRGQFRSKRVPRRPQEARKQQKRRRAKTIVNSSNIASSRCLWAPSCACLGSFWARTSPKKACKKHAQNEAENGTQN